MKRVNSSRYSQINDNYSTLDEFRPEDINSLEEAKELLLPIKHKHNLTKEELKELLQQELSFPSEILNKRLTVLESVVKYLKEEKSHSLRKISVALKRDERNIWHIYKKANEKYKERFVITKPEYLVPISVFSNGLSALESVVVYLREKFELSYHEIAILLKRDDRTIWTVYKRAEKKNLSRPNSAGGDVQ